MMVEKYKIRTDLAMEQKERFESDHVEVSGVVLEEEYDEENSPFDYDASSYDELGDDEVGAQTASGEKWWL